jgi:parallel beta-helix repeat protein
MRRPLLPLVGFVALAFLFIWAFAFGSERVFNLGFDPQDLMFETVKDYDRVKMVDAISSADPGTPLLPIKFIQIAIPVDLEVEEVEVVSFERTELPGTYNIYPAQPFYPLSNFPTKEEDIKFVEPDLSLYQSPSEYPGKLAEVTNSGFLGGQHVAGVALYPLQYIPAEGKLILYTQIEFKLIFQPSSRFPAPVNRRSDRGADFYSKLAKSTVINPEEVGLEAKGSLSREEEVDCLIITHGSFVSTFQELADWKIQKGISTEIKDVSWVLSNYSGYDDPEKIRNCIKDFYSNHGTKWVLLGGDTPILPHRVAPVMSEDIPCDLYFSDLDGDWDANGDHVYGEAADSVDMYPDIFVGRAPCNDVSQAETFVNKSLTYEINPPTDYQTRILYAAEVLWPMTDAAALKNYMDSSFVPGHFQATKLYETSGNLDHITFRDSLNRGRNIINHCGHGDYDKLSLGSDTWFSSDMDDLTNAPRFSLFYTYGCITAAIDMDCIAEHFMNNPDGGGFAYCGNTRYGWGIPGAPLEGPGAEFDIEFFRALFDSANYQVGKTLAASKVPMVPISHEISHYRWTIYTLLLLGDPTLELWTDVPSQLTVSHEAVFFAGMSYFEVNVLQDSALVSCTKDGQILGTAYSDGGSATVYFDSPPVILGTMQVTVTKHDHMPYGGTVFVISPDGPHVIYQSHQTDDSQGNNTGVVNPDETILMSTTVKNIGVETAYGVSATLAEEDDYVEVTESVQSFGDINPGMTAQSFEEYVFQVDASCPDSHLVEFTLEATDGETSWVSHFFHMVVEPDFVITAVPDTTVVQPGDSTAFDLILTSVGGFNWPVDLSHTSLPSGVSGFLDPDQLVPPDTSVFRVYAASDAYPGAYTIIITASGGQVTREKQVVLGIPAPPYYGPLWHVSNAGSDLAGNGSEEFPFGSIQKGIESASGGDTVLAEKGLYVEQIDFLGKPILVASHFILDDLESTVDSTIIHGDSRGSVVTFESGEDSNSVISGFTLTGGYARYGGGIYCLGSSPTIATNFIVGNACGASTGGPGIYCGSQSHARISRNLVANCSGPAAIFLHVDCSAKVINNTVCDNTWGGISIQGSYNSCIRNNIFSNNAAYGIHASESCSSITYNDVYGHDEDYSGIPDQTGENGNISADPLLANPSASDYHLSPGSPCIDAGDPADWVPPGGGAGIDMGAFESEVEGPWVIHLSHQIDDFGGNNNGTINPGETVAMPITARNTGVQTAYNVSGTLKEEDDFITVTESVRDFGDIEPEMIVTSMGAYSFEVDPACPDSHQVTFTLEFTDGSSTWTSSFVEMVADTDFALTVVPDTAVVGLDGFGSFTLTLTSLGGFASQVNLSHSELSSGVSGVLDPDHLVPTDSSIFKIYATSEGTMGIHSVTITANGGGIVRESEHKYLIFVRGNANGDGAVDIGDVIYLVNWVFTGGSAPYPPEAGDANCDGQVDIADIVYLINYLFLAGSPPGC